MKRLLNSTLFLLLFLFFGSAQESTSIRSMADREQSSITYSMRHPLHAWSGVSREVSSVIVSEGRKSNIRHVAVTSRVASFDSKNANRDSHMLEVTEALKFPNITFSGVVLNSIGNKLSVEGELTFHGITQSIKFDVLTSEKNGKLEVTGEFTVGLNDFNITRPSLMGIPTNDEIKVSFKMVY